jgi:hypothetical protein
MGIHYALQLGLLGCTISLDRPRLRREYWPEVAQHNVTADEDFDRRPEPKSPYVRKQLLASVHGATGKYKRLILILFFEASSMDDLRPEG